MGESGRGQVRLGSLLLAAAVVGVWVGMLVLPGIGGLLGTVLLWVVEALAIVAAAMALGGLGMLAFRGVDRLIAWQRREPEWFHPSPVEKPRP